MSAWEIQAFITWPQTDQLTTLNANNVGHHSSALCRLSTYPGRGESETAPGKVLMSEEPSHSQACLVGPTKRDLRELSSCSKGCYLTLSFPFPLGLIPPFQPMESIILLLLSEESHKLCQRFA